MSKKHKAERKAATQEGKTWEAQHGMTIDAILAQLASLKDNAKTFLSGSEDFDAIWTQDIAACEAATDILSTLQDEGIKDPEEVRDLIADYNALAAQYRSLYQKYEEGDKPERLGYKPGTTIPLYVCPGCHRPVTPGNGHCWSCGHKLRWR